MSDPTASQPHPVSQPHPAAQQQAQAFAQQAAPPPAERTPRRVLGIQPVLLVGIVLLTLVTLLTIVLIFVGDIETQAPRVVWTVVAFIGFTALLALDLALSRRSVVPLVIGVAANVYLLSVLMLATWVEPVVVVAPETICDPYDGCADADPDRYGPPLALALFGVYLLAFVVVRAAAAGAWALVALGRRGGLPIARVVGVVAAALVGLAAVLLTMHLAITPFGVRIGDLYWRVAVAVVVLAALAACVTTLLYWSRRQLEPRPTPLPPAAQQPVPQQPVPQQPLAQQSWPDGAWQASQPPRRDQGVVPNPMQPQQPQQQWPPQPPPSQQDWPPPA